MNSKANILDLSSKKIAALYWASYKERSRLKYLKAAFFVAREEEELFSKGK